MNWDLFFKQHEKKAFVIAYKYIRNKEDAFDVIQETMIAIYNKYPNIKEDEARSLFYKILNNKLTDKYRSLKRYWNIFTEKEIEENYSNSNDIENKAAIKDLNVYLENLTPIQQRVFLLKNIEELTFKEMSIVLSISESSCKTHYSRSLKKIKDNVN